MNNTLVQMFGVFACLVALCFSLRIVYAVMTVWNDKHVEPRRVRDFMVTSAAGERQVNLLYAWLDRAKQDGCSNKLIPAVQFSPSRDVVENADMLNMLYNQEHMWAQLDKGHNSLIVQKWMSLLHALFITQVAQTQFPDDIYQLCYSLIQLFNNLIQYSNVYMHAQFPLPQQTYFLQMVVRLALATSANVGFLPGFLLFAHLCPEFVTDDCYPYLNNETHVYQHVVDVWDVEQFSSHYANLIYKYESFVNL